MARDGGVFLMRGFGGTTLRGGQTVFHGIRMWGQMFQAAMLFAAFMTVAVPAWNLWNRSTGAEWYAAGMFTLAEFKLTVGYEPDSGQEIRFSDGTTGVMKLREIVASRPAWRARERIKAEMFRSAWLGAKVGAGMIVLFLVAFWFRGAQLGRQRRLRGAELVTAGELRRRVRPAHLRALDRLPGGGRLRPYRIAGIPYPERTETQHTIVSGTTGSGKTVLISDLVAQIRARGERCVIYDKMGSYTAAFFDPARDVLMNPLDARAPRWSPFLEARHPRDFDMMAAALIPQQKDTVDPFWVTAARQLFSNGAGVFWKKGVEDNKVLVDHLLKTDLTALAEAMEGTVAQSIVDPENPKTALSVRAMLTANLSALEFLPDTGKPFSIRDWIGAGVEDEAAPGPDLAARAGVPVGVEICRETMPELEGESLAHDADAVDGIDEGLAAGVEDVALGETDHGATPGGGRSKKTGGARLTDDRCRKPTSGRSPRCGSRRGARLRPGRCRGRLPRRASPSACPRAGPARR